VKLEMWIQPPQDDQLDCGDKRECGVGAPCFVLGEFPGPTCDSCPRLKTAASGLREDYRRAQGAKGVTR